MLEAPVDTAQAAIKNEATLHDASAVNWERSILEKLAMSALDEQRTARRWRNGIRLAWLVFFT
ncbi:MAG: hypothetical protein RL392_1825, partial [Pseudomonadota bacterium]